MDDKLKTICRVLGKGLMAGGVYVLLWILVVRGHYVWRFSDSVCISLFFIGAVPVYFLLLRGEAKGWGWSYIIAVLLSFFCNFIISFYPVIDRLLYGPGGLADMGVVLIILFWLFMAASKALTLLLMVITVF